MAWTETPDGRVTCEHGSFAKGRSCPTCSAAGTLVNPPKPPGEYELLCEDAEALGMPGRLGVERLIMRRIRQADEVAKRHRRRSAIVRKRGAVRMGREGPIDAEEDKTAQGWDALADQADNRGDKLARALQAMVTQREHYARLERQERLAESIGGNRPRGQA